MNIHDVYGGAWMDQEAAWQWRPGLPRFLCSAGGRHWTTQVRGDLDTHDSGLRKSCPKP